MIESRYLTRTIALAVALLLLLFASGAGICIVFRFTAAAHDIPLEMPGTFVTDGLQGLVYAVGAVTLLRYRRRLGRKQGKAGCQGLPSR